MQAQAYAHTHTHARTHTHTHTCMRIHTCSWERTHTHTHMHAHTCSRAHTHAHTNIYRGSKEACRRGGRQGGIQARAPGLPHWQGVRCVYACVCVCVCVCVISALQCMCLCLGMTKRHCTGNVSVTPCQPCTSLGLSNWLGVSCVTSALHESRAVKLVRCQLDA